MPITLINTAQKDPVFVENPPRIISENSQRKIIHCDADCFFVAVEMRDDPSLCGRPVAVGGSTDRRGVISTCNYEARAYGVSSAMATATAKRLCPDLIVLPGNMEKYRVAASQMRVVFSEYSDLVEPLSLDEAYIDVSGSNACQGSATLIAEEIRRRVKETVGITLSAGVAPNKFLAKIGSDWNKPNGLCVIPPARVDEFIKTLPVDRIFGVGRVTAEKLHRMGIQTCGDLRAFSIYQLSERFGSFGSRLYNLSRGIDDRAVKTGRFRKSLSVEHTFPSDLSTINSCLDQLPALFHQLTTRLQALANKPTGAAYRVNKQFVKIKFNNFQSTTMECIVAGAPRIAVFRELCHESIVRGNGLPVRLMGLGVRFQDPATEGAVQLSLFDNTV
ncbi:MAG: DNA polymerase IV [Oceanicoccus sp.]